MTRAVWELLGSWLIGLILGVTLGAAYLSATGGW